jgi:hypothetical protein
VTLVPCFETDEALYDILGRFFEKVRYVEEAHLIHQVGGSIAFEFSDPAARLTWVPDLTTDAPPFHVEAGGAGAALLTFRQSGDTAHRFWLGYLDLQQALARQQVRASGPLSRAMKLLPHLDRIYPIYHQHLADIGRPDLIWPRTGTAAR